MPVEVACRETSPALPAGRDDGAGGRLGDVGQHAAAHHGQGGRLPRLAGQVLQHGARRADQGGAAGLAGEVDQAEPQRVRAGLVVVGDQPLCSRVVRMRQVVVRFRPTASASAVAEPAAPVAAATARSRAAARSTDCTRVAPGRRCSRDVVTFR